MSFPFAVVMDSEKSLIGSPKWTTADGPDAKMKLVASLMVEGRILQGLELVGRAHADLRNKDSSFTLVYFPTDNRRDAVQMARVDWRPKTPHTNEHKNTPPELLGVECPSDHHHPFDRNWSKGTGRPLKALPIAEPIWPEYDTFEDFVDGVGRFFRITNIRKGVVSPWPKDLLDYAGV